MFRAMQACGIADAFNEAWQVGCAVLDGLEVADADPLGVQGLREALGPGIVTGIAAPAHGPDEAPLLQDAPVPARRVPDATIVVADATGQGPPVFDGCRERRRGQAHVNVAAEGEAVRPSRPGVEDDGQVGEAVRDGDAGDVADPELVRGPRGSAPRSGGPD